MATMTAFVGVLSTPTALGLVPLPGSLAAGPTIYGRVAAIGIALGCLAIVLGIGWSWIRGRRADEETKGRIALTGYVIEMIGLGFTAVGCLLYGLALTGVEQPKIALPVMGLAFGLGVGSAVQLVFHIKYVRANVQP